MHELHLLGERTPEGLGFEMLLGTQRPLIRIAGIPHMLVVEKNRIVAVAKNGNVLEGQQLVGAEIPVLKEGNVIFHITINGVREIEFPVKSKGAMLEVYRMHWYVPDETTVFDAKPLCETPVAYSDKNALLGMDRDETLVFTGDRIDRKQITIKADHSHEWLNFGCAGATLAKLQLTRSTSTTNETSDWRGNQAMLKMLTGDYCGKGVSITAHGTPILWKGGFLDDYVAPVYKLESRWGEYGAKCLNALRLDFFPDAAFPDPHKVLDATCQVPACDNPDPEDSDGALRVSAIPI